MKLGRKRKIWAVLTGILVVFVVSFYGGAGEVGAVSSDKYYFSNLAADYYLTMGEDGTSKMHVKEIITAEFQDASRSHGITRTIPRTNQGGANKVVDGERSLNLAATRNGVAVQARVAKGEGDSYDIYIGNNEEVVQGTQVYTLEYDLADVITEFSETGENVSGEETEEAWQELRWNVNGEGLQPRFGEVRVRLHLEEGMREKLMGAESGEISGMFACAVEQNYGVAEAETERCEVRELDGAVMFTAKEMGPEENLTFLAKFLPGTFVVGREVNYALITLLVIEVLAGAAVTIWLYVRWRKKARRQQKLYRKTEVLTTYKPPKGLRVAEGAMLRIKKTKPSYMATFLTMMIEQKIKIEKKEMGDFEMVIKVESGKFSGAQREVLKILAGRRLIEKGARIPIVRQQVTEKLTDYAMAYEKAAVKSLVEKGEFKPRKSKHQLSPVMVVAIFVVIWILASVALMLGGEFVDFMQPSENAISFGGVAVPILMVVVAVLLIFGEVWLAKNTMKFEKYTDQGIEAARELEGLEQFMRLPEERRVRFLKSVAGMEISAEGLMVLYEGLLPWACLLRIEDEWVKEMEKYFEMTQAGGKKKTGLAVEPEIVEAMQKGGLAQKMFWFDM